MKIPIEIAFNKDEFATIFGHAALRQIGIDPIAIKTANVDVKTACVFGKVESVSVRINSISYKERPIN